MGKKPALNRWSELTTGTLEDHFAGRKETIIGLHAASAEGLARWTGIDWDRHHEEVDPRANQEAALRALTKARSLGCQGFLEDSDGNGGFKVWLLYSEPVSAERAKAFGLWLSNQHAVAGMPTITEVFPKQDQISPGRPGSWLRLPGHHHTRDHWSRIHDGDRWLGDDEAVDFLLALEGGPAEGIPEAALTHPVRHPRRPKSSKAKPPDLGVLRSMLACLPRDKFMGYEHWLKIGTILKPYGDEGFKTWRRWCEACPNFDEGALTAAWPNLVEGEVIHKTLRLWAQQHGWKARRARRTKAAPVDQAAVAAREPAGNEPPAPTAEVQTPDATPELAAGGGQDIPDGSPAPQPPINPPRPAIIWNNLHAWERIERVLDEIRRQNNPPTVFVQGGRLVRVEPSDRRLVVRPLEVESLQAQLTLWMDWCHGTRSRGGGELHLKPTEPPLRMIKSLLNLPDWPEDAFPPLQAIIRCPVYDADGNLIISPGYHSESRLYLDLPDGLRIDEVPDEPTPQQISEAKSLLLQEVLGSFPFADDGSKVNALAFLLTPFVMRLINACVPLGLVNAPVRGTGKTRLAMVLAMPVDPYPKLTAPAKSDEEWEKRITSLLVNPDQVITFDNVAGKLVSSSLELLATAKHWKGRELGYSRMLELEVNSVFLLTANNLKIGGDLVRRFVQMDLDQKTERPEDTNPETFRHPMPDWASENRGRIIWASLVLIQAWKSRGRPLSRATMGSFERWAQIMGGILENAGITGFLANKDKARQAADEDSSDFFAFCSAWHRSTVTNTGALVKDLFPIVEEQELFADRLTSKTERGQRKQLGDLLTQVLNRPFGPFIIRAGGKDASRRSFYNLEYTQHEDDGRPAPLSLEIPDSRFPKQASPPYDPKLPFAYRRSFYDGVYEVCMCAEDLYEYDDRLGFIHRPPTWHRVTTFQNGKYLRQLELADWQYYAFLVELWATYRSFPFVMTDSTLLDFVLEEELLLNVVTQERREDRLAQLNGAIRSLDNPEHPMRIIYVDDVEFRGERRSRYAIKVDPHEEVGVTFGGEPSPFLSTDMYPMIADFLDFWWRSSTPVCHEEGLWFEVLFQLTLDCRRLQKHLYLFMDEQAQRDEFRRLLYSINGIEFHGLMVVALADRDAPDIDQRFHIRYIGNPSSEPPSMPAGSHWMSCWHKNASRPDFSLPFLWKWLMGE